VNTYLLSVNINSKTT